MKKNPVYFICLIIVMLVSLSSCSSKESKQPSSAAIASKIIKSFNSETMVEVTENRLSGYYDFDIDMLDEYAIYVDGSGGFANEVVVLKAKDAADMDTLKSELESRIDNQKRAFDGYNAKELKKIENNLIDTKENYILFVILEDTEGADKIFRSAFE